ncbi:MULTISPECIES: glycosyltransferase family 2 protein [Streptomyces]|uniref:Integral membrane regulatory protein n=1 Tax=Streptomyces coelicolor (strain ATCC BAA-471 / A3(2) / M145) TaxID=100226 RepID=Q9KZL1_STRCO|nr:MULTISPECIES: glycosyltransferase [Streptomyces]MDX2924700.1 glycosyltransferase [Streptomyces sp. NRRL_B-16638]MDX3409973.1 glycosyltransferase [Streptomyces sp. ME02-6977A]MYU42559.1 glycosyltransferase [Streptomyces sp. SID7813]NSL81814.1 glycosyltransferase [Streptomyces coelicolor]QFI43117.1 glycosyltransferase [Streptomyces coelicolor A3(2)]
MSVQSHPAAQQDLAAAPEFPRHVVTAVLVAHDGARWLPDALAGLLGQERPVQYAVAADTGSADDSSRLVAEALGDDRVLHLARRTGFGQAVEEAARTAPVLTPEDLPYLRRPSGWDPVTRSWRDDAYDMPELPHGEPVHWLWLLHDDCAPEPEALAQLLRVVDTEYELGRDDVAVVGPKLRGWYDRRQLLEVGVSIANSGRRWTGLDRREQDQGQHDHVRTVLSVSTAGMLIRRDVFERLGGFDRRLPLMRDDVDLCWRAHAAGLRVLVAPEAVVRHAEAASRERRAVDCAGRTTASPHKVDKAGAVHTLLVNVRTAALPWVLLRIVLGTLLRTVAYLVGKVPGQALDEIRGLLGVLLRPERIIAGRRERGRPQVEKDELRPLFPPPGATVRATVEQVAGDLFGSSDAEAAAGAGRHGGGIESGPGGDDADFLEIEQFARLKRIARKPGPVLFLILLLVSLAACRALLGGGALAGGALLPVPAGAGELWSRYVDAWHTVGTGGTASAPPYLAIVATVASLLLGSTGLAVTLLMVCSVPLAGATAYFASRPLVPSRLLRAWAAVAYAFLPAATGALAGGRIGTAVLAVLLPLIARAGVAAAGLSGSSGARGSWRATWAYALLLTVTTAFTPVVWPVALVLGIGVLALRRGEITAYAPRFLAQLGTPLLLLAPWSLSLLPFGFFDEAGLEYGSSAASALDLLGASPGGPGTVGGLLLLGIVLAALAALLRSERQLGVRTAWVVALVALVFSVLSNRSAWAGPATLVYGIALLSAATLGADGARFRVAEQSFGWRQPVAALIALASALGPLIAAAGWMFGGADGPVERRDPVQVPAFVAEESHTRDQARTLVLDSDSAAHVGYMLVRGSGARLGDGELASGDGGNSTLDKVVANLVAGSGADQADQLGGFAVRYVLVHKGAPREVTRVLDATPGLSRLSQQDGSGLWRVDQEVARATIVSGDKAAAGKSRGGEPEPVAAGPVEIHTDIEAGADGRVLRLADTAAEGWTATLDGKPLTRTTVDGWAQGFQLPASGGRLDVTYDDPFTHTAWLWAQGLLAVVLVVLALPGRRRDVDDDLPDEPLVPAQPVEGEGRRARRLRAQAEAEAEAEAGAFAEAEPGPEAAGDAAEVPEPPAQAPVPVPQQQAYGEWDATGYTGAGYGSYDGGYGGEQYQAAQQYDPGAYGQQPYPAADPYQADAYQGGHGGEGGQGTQYGAGQYDRYAYGDPTQAQEGGYDPAYDQSYGQGGYDMPYDPSQPQQPHGTGSERPDGSQQ